jgi:hypothetical protein
MMENERTCHNCNHKFDGVTCKHGNAERILRLEHCEPCPHWTPIQHMSGRFVREVARKIAENGGAL